MMPSITTVLTIATMSDPNAAQSACISSWKAAHSWPSASINGPIDNWISLNIPVTSLRNPSSDCHKAANAAASAAIAAMTMPTCPVSAVSAVPIFGASVMSVPAPDISRPPTDNSGPIDATIPAIFIICCFSSTDIFEIIPVISLIFFTIFSNTGINSAFRTSPISIRVTLSSLIVLSISNDVVFNLSYALSVLPALAPIASTALSSLSALSKRTAAALPASADPNILEMVVPLSSACLSRTFRTSVSE